jgi:hypothetical protein
VREHRVFKKVEHLLGETQVLVDEGAEDQGGLQGLQGPQPNLYL